MPNIQRVSPSSTALNAEHYQTFEMAKENDTVLGGNDIAQIRSYAAYARAQAQAIHKTIAATKGIEDVAAIKAETIETEQTFAKVSVYADQRIGEILRELPKAKTGPKTVSSQAGEEITKAEALKESGISSSEAYRLQELAANPEVVQAVIDQATADGTVVSRSQVLKAIKERETAEAERDNARQELVDAYHASELLETQIASLKRQVSEKPKPEIVERTVEVVPSDYNDVKRKVASLKRDNERLTREYQEMWQKKRDLDEKLNQANELLGEKDRSDNAQRDIEHLTIATNTYLRNYGGKAWAFDQFDRVDANAQNEFRKAITNLAAFAQNLVQMIQEKV